MLLVEAEVERLLEDKSLCVNSDLYDLITWHLRELDLWFFPQRVHFSILEQICSFKSSEHSPHVQQVLLTLEHCFLK